MQMAEARQSHGLQLTPDERAPMIVAPRLELDPTHDTVPDVLPDAFPVRPVPLRHVRLHPLILLLEGALPVLPVEIPVLHLELLHERPVVVPVAPRELPEAARPPPQHLRAREVGGAGEGRVLAPRREGPGAAAAAGGGDGVGGGVLGVRLGEIRVLEGWL